MKLMSDYLGFPSGDEDVKTLMDAIDEDKSGKISFQEFIGLQHATVFNLTA